jgi:hypothetical protein
VQPEDAAVSEYTLPALKGFIERQLRKMVALAVIQRCALVLIRLIGDRDGIIGYLGLLGIKIRLYGTPDGMSMGGSWLMI